MFAETAGGVTVATARKLIETGQLDPDAETVLLITGDGLKTLDAVSGQVGPTATVPADQQGRARGAGGPAEGLTGRTAGAVPRTRRRRGGAAAHRRRGAGRGSPRPTSAGARRSPGPAATATSPARSVRADGAPARSSRPSRPASGCR